MKILLINLSHGIKSKRLQLFALALLKLSTFYKKNNHTTYAISSGQNIKNITPDVICVSPVFLFNIKLDIRYIELLCLCYERLNK
jgi:hypothetical protein